MAVIVTLIEQLRFVTFYMLEITLGGGGAIRHSVCHTQHERTIGTEKRVTDSNAIQGRVLDKIAGASLEPIELPLCDYLCTCISLTRCTRRLQ